MTMIVFLLKNGTLVLHIHLLCMKEQDRQCAYDVTLWDVRIMFMPPRESKKPRTISSEEVLMAILCGRQQ